MTENELQKKIDLGFDPIQYDNYIKVMILLLDTVEYYNNEMIDYLSKYKLLAFDIKDKVKGIENRIKDVQKSVRPVLVNNPENTLLYLTEWEKFKNKVEEFIKEEAK